MLQHASEGGELVSVALNTHGTRAVQKLIETLTSREQVILTMCWCCGRGCCPFCGKVCGEAGVPHAVAY